MGIVIIPTLITEIEKVYDIYFAAFQGEAMAALMLKILFPNGITEEFRKAHTAATLNYWHTTTTQYTMKAVDTDTGEIVGMLLGDWHLQGRTPEERQYHGIPWLEGEARERAEKVVKPLWEAREELWGGRPHLYCHVIAIDPKHQRRGGAHALMKWGGELADASNLPIYFESSPTTAKLYERGGFQTVERKVVHKAEVLGIDKDIEVPLMVRMPAIAKGVTFDEWRAKGYPSWDQLSAPDAKISGDNVKETAAVNVVTTEIPTS